MAEHGDGALNAGAEAPGADGETELGDIAARLGGAGRKQCAGTENDENCKERSL